MNGKLRINKTIECDNESCFNVMIYKQQYMILMV